MERVWLSEDVKREIGAKADLKPWGPVPTPRQARWHALEYYGFAHFTVNTFTGKEWGYGDESPSIFNPTELDARQWAETASDAGMKGLILTAKHHDGFCLWPSPHTKHSVKASPWRGGKGDVVAELAEACREYGLLFGLYLSPWDRNHAAYGTPEYVEYYKAQLHELVTGYGELFEVWFDGANGGDGYYGGARTTRHIDKRNYYDFPALHEIVRRHQPDAVIFSDAGPDIRWVGNEAGFAPDTCWHRINPKGMYTSDAPLDRLASGDVNGPLWRPAEVDVSIRKGWFFHPEEEPKSPDRLMEIYMQSVGRGCCLLLNITPDKRGLIPDEDVAVLKEFKARLDASTAVCIAKSDCTGDSPLCLPFGAPNRVGLVRVEECIALGQRVSAFELEARDAGEWRVVAKGGTIGARRLLDLGGTRADALRLRLWSEAVPVLSHFAAYKA